jgi:hypothetical protein
MKAKQINHKRLLLFIIEGATDKITLENILKKNFPDKKICFKTVKGDITAEENTDADNIEGKLYSCVKDFLARNGGFKRTDIIEIVQLTDVDGAFLSNKRVVYNKEVDLSYYEKRIESNKSYKIMERNERKSAVLSHLSAIGQIGGIKYSLYYFSSNIEHVLHGKQLCTDAEKENKAYEFAQAFQNREEAFVQFLTDEGVAVDLPYAESWELVKKGANSLKRLTNINLLFKRTDY